MKKLLSVFLAVAVILCFGAFAASAEETTTEPVHTDHCYCVNGEAIPEDHVCEENVVWEALTTGTTIADGGHYYLPKNTAKGLTINGIEVTICLNGYNLYAGTPITVTGGGVVNICNCKPSSGSRIYSTNRTSGGVVVLNCNTNGYGTVNLFSGKISGAANGGAYARCVEIIGGTFNMYGGEIVNGRSDGTVEDDIYKGEGGNVMVRNHTSKVGEFNMFAGTVTGGQANNYGGNIFVRGGKFTMNGGVVTGGKTLNTPTEEDTTLVGAGGNIYITSTASNKRGTLILNGGIITGGNAYCGGNIASAGANSGAAVLTINNGATIQNGVAAADGGNLYMYQVTNGTVFTMNGGTISGGIASGNGGNIAVKEGYSPKWLGGTVSGGNAAKGGNIYFDCGSSPNSFAGTNVTGGTATEYGGNICIQEGGALNISAGTISGGTAQYGGNIYSRKTVNISGGIISGGVATASAGNVYATTYKLTISGGEITGGKAGTTGGNVYALNNTVDVIGGSITNGEATSHGGNLYITNIDIVKGRTVTISDVTVSGGVSGKQGGNIYIGKADIVNMTNVTALEGKAATNGANVYLMQNNTGTITGCTFTIEEAEKCASSGGNLVLSGYSYTITDTTVSGGDAAEGSAVALGQTAEATFDGCTIQTAGGGTGRCIFLHPNAKLTLKDCDVKNLSEDGTTIWNKGALTLQGTVNMPGLTLDLMLDCRDESGATIDISGLTRQDDIFGLRRWEVDSKEDDPGLVASNVTGDNWSMLFAWSDGYELAYDSEAGTLTMVYMPVLGRNGDGIARGYYSLDEALFDEQDMGITWYVLTTDLEGQTISKNVMIDLNGHDLTDCVVEEGVSLKLFDSANDSYDATACGSFTGAVDGQIVSVVHTDVNNGGSAKHYVILKDAEDVYTAHRFVAAIVTKNLKPNQVALGFKASFSADEVARAAAVAYGFEMWVDGGTAVISAKEGSFTKGQHLTLRLQNILSEDESDSKVGATGTIYGNPFITFVVDPEGTQVHANGQNAPTAVTLKSFVEAVNRCVADDPTVFTEAQMTAMQTMVNTYAKYMTDWATESIVAWTVPVVPETPEVPETTEPTE